MSNANQDNYEQVSGALHAHKFLTSRVLSLLLGQLTETEKRDQLDLIRAFAHGYNQHLPETAAAEFQQTVQEVLDKTAMDLRL